MDDPRSLKEREEKILALVTRLWGLAMEKQYSHAIKREWGELLNLLNEYFVAVKHFLNQRKK